MASAAPRSHRVLNKNPRSRHGTSPHELFVRIILSIPTVNLPFSLLWPKSPNYTACERFVPPDHKCSSWIPTILWGLSRWDKGCSLPPNRPRPWSGLETYEVMLKPLSLCWLACDSQSPASLEPLGYSPDKSPHLCLPPHLWVVFSSSTLRLSAKITT